MATLGLDLGPNSIGWALISEDSHQIIDLGVRVFPEGVDNFDTSKEVSRNEARRIARGMRRQILRRKLRRCQLRDVLITVGLFPRDPAERDRLFECDPYELRARALQEKLTLNEIGRVFLHLNQRRGFLSNRKKDRGDKEVKGMLAEISDLANQMDDRTLGQFLYEKVQSLEHTKREESDHIRNRHTRRSMLKDEFKKIWEAQNAHHPKILTTELKYGKLGRQTYPCKPRRKPTGMSDLEAFGIHGLIFFQRKMYWPKSVIGLCELEPKEKRCGRADRHAQRFRLLQEVNNLRYINPDVNEERSLSVGQRELVLNYLSTREKATFDQIRKKLGFLESVKFNLERGKRPSIKGMVTDWMIAKAVGKEWHERPAEEKDAIVRLLLDIEADDDATHDKLISDYGLTPVQAEAAIDIDFPSGYVNLSLKAIDRILPHLESGLVFQSVNDPEQSALHAAGYLRRDEIQRRLFDKLPDPQRMSPQDCPIGDIPNPVVKRALVELRKVVNAIIREYGKPDAVHVEMARSVRMGPKARREYNSIIREREAKRDAAANELRRLAFKVSRDAIIQYLLWDEQQHECIYCGEPISQQQLFGGDIDVDHILPYSRSLDDSQANKVVCHRRCNHDKGQRTPYEWLADSNSSEYERLCQHVGSLMRKGLLPYGKYRKFLQKELDLDQFIARQLADTGYIARTAAEYLRCLFEHDHDVLGLKGQHTAELRRQWGLNTVLRHDDEDMKNRDDHRHHAVDALVIALTNRSRLQQLTRLRKLAKFRGDNELLDQLPDPWDGFRDEVAQRVNQIKVSHRPERKVAGALHKDSFYGQTEESGIFVKREPLEELSASDITLIRDPGIRRIIEKRLSEHGLEIGRGKKVNKKKWKEALCNIDNPVTMPSGVPIKKVRVLRKEQTIQPIRDGSPHVAFVKPGENHHVCIFEWTVNAKTERDAEYCTLLEASKRVKNHEAIVRRTHSNRPEARHLMSLCTGDLVLADVDGSDRLMVVSTLVSTQKRIHLVDVTDARRSAKRKDIGLTPNSLIANYNARKVTVDPLGRIRWAND